MFFFTVLVSCVKWVRILPNETGRKKKSRDVRLTKITTFPSDMSILIKLPLTIQLRCCVDGEAVSAQLVKVHRQHTVTVLKTPSRYNGLKFKNLRSASHFLVGDKGAPVDFVVLSSSLDPDVMQMCESYSQLTNARVRERNPKEPLYVELRVLMYLEYLGRVVWMPDSLAATSKYRDPQQCLQRRAECRRIPSTVMRLRRNLDVPDFRWGRRRSEMHFRHVSELPEEMNKRCALDIQHVSGYRDALNFLRRSGMSALIATPKDFFAAYWLPWQRFSKHTLYLVELPEDFPQSGVLPLDVRWDALARDLDRAWDDMEAEHRSHVVAQWLRFSVNRCNTGPQLMEWWAVDFGQQCPAAREDATVALFERAKVLEGRMGDHNWLARALQEHTVHLMSKVDPQPDEPGEEAWVRLIKYAVEQSIVDNRATLAVAQRHLKRKQMDS